MADTVSAAENIPIAQLNPNLSSLSTKAIKAIVTLIWPYSSSKSSLTVLLAEPDIRLRRARGQVRVQFLGSSARSVFETGIGSGDIVTLGLEGAEWTKDESAGHTPGRGIEWGLKYGERLRIQIQESETQKISAADIDHPSPRRQADSLEGEFTTEVLTSPLVSTVSQPPRPKLLRSETNEWASPAFVKRARISYGSLFQSGYDMFAEDDGTIKGKGRKRARFSRAISNWRYSSRSPSFEPEDQDEESGSADSFQSNEERKPLMTDEGCQTLDLEDSTTTGHEVRSLERKESNVDRETFSPNRHSPSKPVVEETDGGLEIENASSKSSDLLRNSLSQKWRATEEDVDKEDPIADGVAITPLSPQPSRTTRDAVPMLSQLEGRDTNGVYGDRPFGCEKNDLYEISPSRRHHADSHEKSQITIVENPDTSDRSSSPELEDFVGITRHELRTINHERMNTPSHTQSRYRSHSAKFSESDTRTDDEDLSYQSSAKHLSTSGFAMSRSQSGQSDLIDLTGESDAEVDEPSNGSTVGEAEKDGKLYLESRFDDSQSEEEQGNQNGYSENDQSLEDEFYPENKEMFSDGWHSFDTDTDTGSEEQSEEEDGFASGEDDLIDQVGEQSAAVEGEQACHSNVIDLISSDEDDTGKSNSRRQDSEDIDIDNTLNGEFYTKAETDSDMDADGEIENDPDDDSAHETQLNTNEIGELPTTLEKLGSMSGVIAEDHEVSELSLPNEPDTIEVLASKSEPDEPHEAQDSSLGHKGGRFQADFNYYSEYGGSDGASDEPKYPVLHPHRLEVGSRTAHSNIEGFLESRVTREMINPTKPFNKVQSNEKEGFTEISGNGQLQTPDATQATAIAIINNSFDANISTTSFQSRTGNETVNDGLHCPPAGAVGVIELKWSSATDNRAIQNSVSSEIIDPAQNCSPERVLLDAGGAEQQTCKQEQTLESHSELQNYTRDVATAVVSSALSLNSSTSIQASSDKPVPVSVNADHKPELVSEQRAVETVNDKPCPTPVMELSPPPMAVSPFTPRKSKRLSHGEEQGLQPEQTPMKSSGEPTQSEYDASVELAIAALKSPNEEADRGLILDMVSLRVKLSHPLRTSLGDFTTMKLIRFNLEKKLDFLGIVTAQPAEPQRAKKGLRQYHLSFNITDATIAPKGVIPVHIFRPFKLALPIVCPGNGVLLRNFQVKSEARGFALRSDDSSGWVVFNHDGNEEVRGPPVEYGDEERLHVASLSSWYRNLDVSYRDKLEKANGDKASESARKSARSS